jgi:hypothetical protein
MTYYYYSSDELYESAPNSTCSAGISIDPGSAHSPLSLLPKCSNYYINGLYRQHTNAALFRNFSSLIGHAYLVSSTGYYVACVSAGSSNAHSVAQDGTVMLQYMKKDVKDARRCAASFPSQLSSNTNGTMPMQHWSFTTPA